MYNVFPRLVNTRLWTVGSPGTVLRWWLDPGAQRISWGLLIAQKLKHVLSWCWLPSFPGREKESHASPHNAWRASSQNRPRVSRLRPFDCPQVVEEWSALSRLVEWRAWWLERERQVGQMTGVAVDGSWCHRSAPRAVAIVSLVCALKDRSCKVGGVGSLPVLDRLGHAGQAGSHFPDQWLPFFFFFNFTGQN